MIRHLIFDYGQVLVRHNPVPLLHRICNGNEKMMDGLRQILSGPDFPDRLDRGTLPFSEAIDYAIGLHPDYHDALLCFRDHVREEITGEIEGMREVLSRLRQAGYDLYGLSNWSNTVYEVIDRFPVFRLLDGMVISCEEHCVKPEAEIYRRLYAKYNLKPEECLFADDRLANVEGARRTGMEAILFTDAAQYVRDLRETYGITI